MTIDSSTVQGRRNLRFNSLDELVAEAEMLVSSPSVKTLGNWQLSQLLMHLSLAINFSIDGMEFKMPWYVRLIGQFKKRRFMKHGLPVGVKLPKDKDARAFPTGASPEEALAVFRKAVARLESEKATSFHPFFGKMTPDDWDQFHLRHAELHLGFVIP